MNPESIDLERCLSAMTEWRDQLPKPGAWESALARHDGSSRRAGVLVRVLQWNMPRAMAASIFIVLTLGLAIGLLLPSIGKARNQSTVTKSQASAANMAELGREWNDRSIYAGNRIVQSPESSGVVLQDGPSRPDAGMGGSATANSLAAAVNSAATPDTERMVVRKATIELQTADVRGVFLKAALLISEAGGEYVEQSSLNGEGASAQANITLRVANTRLDQVMNALRDLAHVQSENLVGDDVTAQVVDLDARLRNEQRIEKELLDLLDKRVDSPLNDVLQLRGEIARIRQNIEQIAAQQQRLSRLVSLATILIIIRAAPAHSTVPEPQLEQFSVMRYFGGAIGDSWNEGVRFLADSLAGLLGVLVGGAMWWIAVIIGLLALRQHLRRRAGLI